MPRLFVAVRVPLSAELLRVLRRLGEIRGIKPVPPEHVHYTLRFIGDVDEALAASLQTALGDARLQVAPFDVSIEGTGAFPSTRQPRVVWAGCDAASRAPFAALAAGVDGIVDGCGAPRRDKPFVPHLTLARVRVEAGRGAAACASVLAEEAETRYGHARVGSVTLVASVLSAAGSTYTDVLEVPLS